ncbi:hypothetical protein ABBQ32_005082 [Trebouxia sp. C0010 RCD-2024]
MHSSAKLASAGQCYLMSYLYASHAELCLGTCSTEEAGKECRVLQRTTSTSTFPLAGHNTDAFVVSQINNSAHRPAPQRCSSSSSVMACRCDCRVTALLRRQTAHTPASAQQVLVRILEAWEYHV